MRFLSWHRHYSLRLEWLLLVAVLTACVVWFSGSGFLARSNAWLQDVMVRLQGHPASADVVLVLADDRSVATIGRWPWRRALHAQVLRHIDQGDPQSIGMDILFAEEDWDYPEDDWLLARAIADSGKVVLPVTRPMPDSSAAATKPLSIMVQAAARLGHTNVVRDVDGGVRSFYQLEGPASAPWLHLGLAMLCVERPDQLMCQSSSGLGTVRTVHNPALWLQRHPTHIAFADGAVPFTSYSYADVLQGRIPSSAFRNKHVLIGASATGVATLQPTPGTQYVMSNVELVGHIVSGALQHLHTQAASDGINQMFNLIPVWLGLLALAWLGPSAALVASLVLGLCTLLAATLALLWWQVAFMPAAALLGLLLAYPLWSWRRLNAAARFLEQEMQRLPGQQLLPVGTDDFLQRRIAAVERASQQLRQLHHFVSETLLQLPAPTLACDCNGGILLFNSAAQRYAQSLQRSLVQGQNVADLLQGATQRDTQRPLWEGPSLLSTTHLQCEGIDACQRSLLLIARPFTVAQDTGWLITLVDISELRDALAQRDQAMHFISHDIRAPIGAILSLIDMERSLGNGANDGCAGSGDLMERIQRYARNSLVLADDFVHLARAQQQKPAQYQLVDLGMVMEQALDDAWALAAERKVQLHWPVPDDIAAWVRGDTSQLRRACLNLLTNAIKYGPVGGTVHCTLEGDGECWVLGVRDEGAGIAPQEQQRLFAPFARQRQHEQSAIAGIGLGLAYVRTVMIQHGGNISVCNVEDGAGAVVGAHFRLSLPQCPEPVHSCDF